MKTQNRFNCNVLQKKSLLKFILIYAMAVNHFGCANKPAESDDSGSESAVSDESFNPSGDQSSDSSNPEGSGDAPAPAASSNGDLDLEKEFANTDGASAPGGDSGGGNVESPANGGSASVNAGGSEQSDLSLEPQNPANNAQMDSGSNAGMGDSSNGGSELSAGGMTSSGSSDSGAPQNLVGLKFQANDAGGTVVIELSGTPNYTTRTNAETNQLIIELNNTHLQKKFKRNLNTKDMAGGIGAVDAYQNPGSSTARVVVQLRKGYAEPSVQQEGNNILVIANGASAVAAAPEASSESSPDSSASVGDGASGSSGNGEDGSSVVAAEGGNSSDGPILQSHNLTEFLGGNTKFYGRKISLETNDMDVRDALKFIMLESGVNMVVGEEVKGRISLKLRQVPWDQALIMVMRAKKLGYTRIGNILRIANLSDLKQEEDDAIKLAKEQTATQALKVRMFPVNYGKVDELEKKVKDFLTERGKVVSDPRTNYLVVSDIEESLNRVAKLISSLDIQPPQVLIEGRIVEAKDSFKRSIGFTWNVAGQAIPLGKKTLNMTPQLDVNPLVKGLKADSTGIGSFGLNLGVLDFLGQLDATLVLAERDETVKVISSPRIVTMTNEKANINEKTQIPIKRTILNGAQAQTTYDFKDLNLKLEVTPQITSDGSVIMQVEVMREVQGAAVNIADQVPSINSRQATTRVLVRNGQTAIIGGIYQNDVSELSEGVPYLKDLPGLGFLFRNRVTSREKQELLVFLTPRILSQVDAQNLPSANGGI